MADAFWLIEPGLGELRPTELPACEPGEVRVRTLYSGISRGTEALVFRGQVPESEYARMRAPFQEGDFPAPVKYGYNAVGVVEQGVPELVGREVFCLYPHQSFFVVPADAVTPLPSAVPAERAVLAANMETAINGLWDANPRIGDRISVVGAGAVGCLVAWLANRIPGCSVELIDCNPARSETADALGVAFRSASDASPNADLVIHASGAGDGLSTALGLAGFEATVLEMSWYGNTPTTLGLGGAFHSKRLDLRASQVGHIATAQRSRWDVKRRMALALSLLRFRELDCLITGESRFSDLPHLMTQLVSGEVDGICHRINYAQHADPTTVRTE